MGIIRNSIDVVGITPESDIPKTVMGQIVEYSETEYISILQEQPGIKNIIQVILEIEIKIERKEYMRWRYNDKRAFYFWGN